MGLGAAVSLLVALTVGTLAALTSLNTRTIVFKLVHERVDELLVGLGAVGRYGAAGTARTTPAAAGAAFSGASCPSGYSPGPTGSAQT